MFDPRIGIVVKLFPLLLPIWQERPITRADFYPEPYQYGVQIAEVALQRQALRLTDYDQRSAVARQLRESGRREALILLQEHLGKEKEAAVIATVLQQLAAMAFEDESTAAAVKPLLSHDNSGVRCWAVKAWGRLENSDVRELTRILDEDPNREVRLAAATELGKRAETVALPILRRYAGDKATAVRVAIYRNGTPRNARLLDTIDPDTLVSSEHALVRVAVAEAAGHAPPDHRLALLRGLASDPVSVVRKAAAVTLGTSPKPEGMDVLLALTKDVDADVRRVAATGLPRFPLDAALEALVTLLEDPANLVREASEQALVTMNGKKPVADDVAPQMLSTNPFCRYRAYRVLGRTGASPYTDQLVAALGKEAHAEALSGCVYALGLLGAHAASRQIAALSNHASPRVRQEVAGALGRLAEPATFPKIHELVFDRNAEVRREAILAAARTGDGRAFSRTALKVLMDVSSRTLTPQDRAQACWCAARITPLSLPLQDRLVQHATTAVIPIERTFEFDLDEVLISASFALAQHGRKDAGIGRKAAYVIQKHGHTPTMRELSVPGVIPLVPSPEVKEYARQATGVLTGQRVEKAPRPTDRLPWTYGREQPRR